MRNSAHAKKGKLNKNNDEKRGLGHEVGKALTFAAVTYLLAWLVDDVFRACSRNNILEFICIFLVTTVATYLIVLFEAALVVFGMLRLDPDVSTLYWVSLIISLPISLIWTIGAKRSAR